jgi:DNA-binding MarR family transcriptional regulator
MPPIDFNGLDSAVHGPIRLGILTTLHIDGPLDFTSLNKRLNAHDGSLNLHLGKLAESGYIAGRSASLARRPQTIYRITPAGRKALAAYLHAMRQVIDAVESTRR